MTEPSAYHCTCSQPKAPSPWAVFFLVSYVLVLGVGSAVLIIANFPAISKGGRVLFPPVKSTAPDAANPAQASAPQGQSTGQEEGDLWGDYSFRPFLTLRSVDQGLLLLAFLAGITGSFLHAGQSLSTYLGNSAFRPRWFVWYFLRPWIGGVLGLAVYFALRAGLVAGVDGVNPYGVVALGLLGGWFSKNTTDKLQEVFEILFKTDEDMKRKDKLKEDASARPVIDEVRPSPVPKDVNEITIVGKNFREGATVRIDDAEFKPTLVSATTITVTLAPRPTGKVRVRVKNPDGPDPLSASLKVHFE